jgi:serine protease Do
MKRQIFALVALTAVVSFLLGLVVSGTRPAGTSANVVARPTDVAPAPLSVSTAPMVVPPARGEGVGVDFSIVAARLNAAVVNIDAATRGSERPPGAAPRRFQRDGTEDESAPREGSGSGFIIDRAGFILTNHHLVEGADRVTVTLGDGRVFRANIVGADPAIDVALLQIPASEPLPVAPLGNSDGLRAGEWVCAIGNPLGYVHSVTVGVVSFLGRKLFDPSLDEFIQTDAAINFGNSGGPLINARGEVIGINTLKLVKKNANGIGFALSSSDLLEVLRRLSKYRCRLPSCYDYSESISSDRNQQLSPTINFGFAAGSRWRWHSFHFL